MPEVTTTTYMLAFIVPLFVTPFAWAMMEYRSLPRGKRPFLGSRGLGSLVFGDGGWAGRK